MADTVDAAAHTRYHLLVQGEVGADWAGWFDDGIVEGCVASGGYTALVVRVPDQSALLALINRLHALHLPLLVLVRLPT